MTLKRLTISPLAERDIRAAVLHYRSEGGEALAQRFVGEVERGLARIASRPGIGSPRFGIALDLPGLRSVGLSRFPYLVFYLDLAERLDVWRVLHARRDIPALLQID